MLMILARAHDIGHRVGYLEGKAGVLMTAFEQTKYQP